MENKIFVTEVPRFFSRIEAEDKKAAIAVLEKEAATVVAKHAVIEELKGAALPTAKEAMVSKTKNLPERIVNIFNSGTNIAKATKGVAFLGIGDGDILFGASLCKELGIAGDDMKDASFMSLGGYLSDITSDIMKDVKPT